jgi:hypothetical protein
MPSLLIYPKRNEADHRNVYPPNRESATASCNPLMLMPANRTIRPLRYFLWSSALRARKRATSQPCNGEEKRENAAAASNLV